MKLEAAKYLYDIQRAANPVTTFTDSKTLQEYTEDAMLRSAVERQFEIIGEAMTNLTKVDAVTADRFTNHRSIVAFRNVLIHGCADVDDRLVWDVIKTNLLTLTAEVDALLEESEGN